MGVAYKPRDSLFDDPFKIERTHGNESVPSCWQHVHKVGSCAMCMIRLGPMDTPRLEHWDGREQNAKSPCPVLPYSVVTFLNNVPQFPSYFASANYSLQAPLASGYTNGSYIFK